MKVNTNNKKGYMSKNHNIKWNIQLNKTKKVQIINYQVTLKKALKNNNRIKIR